MNTSSSRRVVLMGPGFANGSLPQQMADQLQVPHLNMSQVLGREAASGSPLGQQIDNFMQRREPIPGKVISALLDDRLTADDVKDGFVLSGHPRCMADAIDLIHRNVTVIGLKVEFPAEAHRLVACQAQLEPIVDVLRREGLYYEADGRSGTPDEVMQRMLAAIQPPPGKTYVTKAELSTAA